MKKIISAVCLITLIHCSYGQSYKVHLEKINAYLKTFDNGYYGYLEIKDGYLYDRFPSGKYTRSEIKYLGEAYVADQNKKVSIDCIDERECVYSTYTDSYYNSIGFSQSADFNTAELISMLNNLITAYNGSSNSISTAKSTTGTITKSNNNTALQKLNDYLKTFDDGYYGYFEVVGKDVYLRFKSGKYNKYAISEMTNAEIQSQYSRVILPCKDKKQCIYTTWKDGYEDYTQFLQGYKTFNYQELKDLLDNFVASLKENNNSGNTNTAAIIREQKNKERQQSTTNNPTGGNTDTGKNTDALKKLNDYLKTFNSETYDKVEVKDNKVFFYFKVYSVIYNSSISISDLLQNTTVLKGKSVGEFGKEEIKIFCKNDMKYFYSTYSKGNADHFRFFSNTVKDLTKMEQLVKEFISSLQ